MESQVLPPCDRVINISSVLVDDKPLNYYINYNDNISDGSNTAGTSVLTRLQLIVIETGQLWKRALVRMVLEPGSGNVSSGSGGGTKFDYGTLSLVRHHNHLGSSSNNSDTNRMSTQDSLHQRQPLLQTVVPIDDSDDENDGLRGGGGGGGGGVMIRPPSHSERISMKLGPPIKDEPRYPKEIFKTFLAFLIQAVGMILNTASLSMVHERVPNLDVAERNVSKPLPDIILDNIPTNDTWALNASEIIIMISVNSVILVVIFHKHRFIVARRVFLIMGILYMFRCLTMYVTVLPVASYTYKCSPRAERTSVLMYIQRTWQLLTGFGLSINGKHTYCGDYMYSGHTLMLVMAYLTISEYSPRKLFPLHWISWSLSMFGIICVLIARGHYTIDVVVAYYVTTRTFWIYHTLACNQKFKEYSAHNYLSRAWWFPVFRYFEGNILGPVPRQYEWPLPWPRRFLSRRTNRDS